MYNNQLITDDPDKLLSLKEVKVVLDQALGRLAEKGNLNIRVGSWWGYSQRWARNKKLLSTDQRSGFIDFGYLTNQMSPENVNMIASYLDHYRNYGKRPRPLDMEAQVPDQTGMGRKSVSTATLNPTKEKFQSIVSEIISNAKADKLMSAGEVECIGSSGYVFMRDEWNRVRLTWHECTQARVSITIRDPKGNGSGWVGRTSYDIDAIDLPEIARLSHERCVQSTNPIRLEPGRYNTILSPQVTAVLMTRLLLSLDRHNSELPGTIHYVGYDATVDRHRGRIGLKVVDDRITVSHDPRDPLLGTPVQEFVRPITWIKNGVLADMHSHYDYTLSELNSGPGYNVYRNSFMIDGTDTELDEIINQTERGLLLARVSNTENVHAPSMLMAGYTRDGLWLVEKGKISKAVRNFRFTESPLFAFNNVIAIGKSELIYSPVFSRPLFKDGAAGALSNISAPYMQVNDFSFTSTIDAI